ncbi:hypothetical protein LTR85_003796 [Meristemomyces frigidus]|nr:hypothetical protein LTR85_003796 [Meristemomyces frigidus]
MTAITNPQTSSKATDEQQVAYHLLIELLAHQFAFPVRWIETQDVLFSRRHGVERFVELGPGAVLTNMARKTLRAKYQTRDRLLGLQRSFLFCGSDAAAIRYQYEARDGVDEAANDDGQQVATTIRRSSIAVLAVPPGSAPKRGSVVEEMLHAASSPPAATVAASSIADVPVPALQMILAIVAFKMRKPLEQIPTTQSLKDLSSGKSTLQNELLGDITNQFGSTPDGAEDMPLAALAEAVEPGNTGQPSLALAETIGRWISSIMPPKCNLKTLREYLKESWGLGPARQTSVTLFALTQTVADDTSRLPTSDAVKALFDTAALKYAHYSGLTLQKTSASSSSSRTTAAHPIDHAALDKITQEQRALAQLQHQALAGYLGLEGGVTSQSEELEASNEVLLTRLRLWDSEYGVEFEAGIQPCFDAKHLRHFDSAWSQAQNEVCKIYHDTSLQEELLQAGPLGTLQSERLLRVACKSDQRTLDLVTKMLDPAFAGDNSRTRFRSVGKALACLIRASLAHSGPHLRFAFEPRAPRTVIGADGLVKYTEVPRTVRGSPAATYIDVLTRHEHAGLKTQVNGQWFANDGLTRTLFDVITTAQESGLSFKGKTVLLTGAGQGSIGAEVARSLLTGGATVILTTSRKISDAQDFYRQMYRECGARGSELFVLPYNQASMKDCRALVDYIYAESGLCKDVDVLIPFAAMPEGGAEIDQLGPRAEIAHRLMLTNVLRLIGNVVRQKAARNIQFHPTQVLLPLSPNHGSFGGDGLYCESKLGLEGLLSRFESESWKSQASICGVTIGWTRGTGLMESNDELAEAVESQGILTFSQQEMALNILSLLSPEIARFNEDEAILADFSGGLQRLQNVKAVITEARTKIRENERCNKAIFEEDARERAMTGHVAELSTPIQVASPPPCRSRLQLGFPALPGYDDVLKAVPHNLEGMVDLSSTVVIVGFSELGPWGNARTRWQMESQQKLAQAGHIELAWMMGLIKHFDGEHKSAGGHYIGWVDCKSGDVVPDCLVPERYSAHILGHAGIRLIEPENLGGYDPLRKEFMQEIGVDEDLPEFDTTIATAEGIKRKHGDHVRIHRLGDSDTARVQLKAGARIMVPKVVPFASGVVAGLLPTGWNAGQYGIPNDIIKQVDLTTLYTLCCVAEAFLSAGIEQPQEVFKYIHFAEMGNFIGSALGPTTKSREMFHDVRMNKQVQGDVYAEMNVNTPAAWVNMLLLGASGPIKTPVGACATGLESLDAAVDSIASGKTSMCLVGAVDNFQEDESYAFSTIKATVDATKQFAEGRQPAEFSRPTAETRAGFLESQGCGVQLVCSAELALQMGLPIHAVVAGSAMAADKINRSVPAPGQGLLTFAREDPAAAKSPLLDVNFRRCQMETAISRVLDMDCASVATTDVSRPEFSGLTPPSSVSEWPTSRSVSSGSEVIVTQAREGSAIHAGRASAPAVSAEIRNIRRQWGNDLRTLDPRLSPMRASLAVFGLTVDDVSIVSLHATSTKANDINEPKTVNEQMIHLGRQGAPLLAICQKSVTGHPKGPAASWMLNGCMQAMQTGLVPGNFACDNIDIALQSFEHLAFPTETMRVDDVKAFLVNSFGFGQKGAQMVGVNPRYLFATLTCGAYGMYERKCSVRKRLANRAFAKAVTTNSIVKMQTEPPYKKADMAAVLLDPTARLSTDPETKRLYFDPAFPHGDLPPVATAPLHVATTDRGDFSLPGQGPALTDTTEETHSALGNLIATVPRGSCVSSVGVDIESAASFTSDANPVFIDRNFADSEKDAARQSGHPHQFYVSRWCAKEAVFKCFGVRSRGAGAPMKEIEISNDEHGTPKVQLYGEARRAAQDAGVSKVLLSISYGDGNVIAVAVATKASKG